MKGQFHPFGSHRTVTLQLVLLALFAFLALPFTAFAQDTGYISGTVIDKSGAAIAGAEVSVVSVGGNLTRNTTSNTDGAYVAAGLPGGTYNIVVSAKGFQKFTAQKVVLEVAQKIRVDVTLTVGALNEEVVVTGENVAQVETQSSEISSTVTGKQVNELELNGRNFTQLVTLVPGVVNQTGQDEGAVGVGGSVAYSVNGGRTEYNNWEIDGGDTMDNGSNGTLNVYPNLEAIAEFKVLTSNYGAQYGRNGSGTVEVETKSGTSAWHGSAFYYGRNEAFNARSWDEGADPTAPKAQYRKHDWGYTFGGPISIPHVYNSAKKKTFFFWSQEWRRESNPNTTIQNVPSDAERAGDFSDLCPGPDCPSGGPSIAPTTMGLALLQMVPHANGFNGVYPDGGPNAEQPLPAYINTISLPTTWREELIRVDHNLTDGERLTFRYIHDSWKQVTPQPLWSQYSTSFDNINTNFAGPGTSFVARLNSTITPTLLNEFVASYTADHIILSNTGPIGIPDGLYDSIGKLYDNAFGGKLPAFSVDNGLSYGGGFSSDSGYMPWKNANPTYTYRDNLTKIVGNHTLTMGFYFVAAQKNQENSVDVQGQYTFDINSPVTSGNAFADLLLGNINAYSQNNAQTLFYDRYKILEPYFQDDWRVSKRLTLNLGLRWSFFGRYQELFNQEWGFSQANFNPANAPTIDFDGSVTGAPGAIVPGSGDIFNGFVQCGVSPAPTGCLKNKKVNPSPRIGFAFDPKGDGKTAIRGGYGIFFEHTNGNEANAESLQQGATPVLLSSTQFNVGAADGGYSAIGSGGLAFPLTPWSIPEQVQWPYVQQWNLDVQREIPGNMLVSFAYVGSKGTHLTLQRDLNQLPSIPLASNPFQVGQFISPDQSDCENGTTSTGVPITGAAATNFGIACGADPTPFRPFQGFGSINRLENTANSIYNSLQITARKNVGNLTFSLAYTYSHSIDDSSDRYDSNFVDSYNPNATRAASTFDLRHSISLSYVYALPFFKSPGFLHSTLGGWQVSGITIFQTGTPFTVTNGTAIGDNAGVGNGLGTASFPDLVGSPYVVSAADKAASASNIRGPLAYNPAAFELPRGLTFGNVGRDTLRNPGRTNFDFGLFKRFTLSERALFEFRAETFNLFNHTQFSSVNGSMDCVGTDPTTSSYGNGGDTSCVATSGFLHLGGPHAPRRMQLGLRFQF